MSWRTTILTTATAAMLALGAGSHAMAQAAPVALVIGNGDYDNYADLRSSAKDAETIASQLIANGYDVTLLMDANAQSMREALSAFVATGDAQLGPPALILRGPPGQSHQPTARSLARHFASPSAAEPECRLWIGKSGY